MDEEGRRGVEWSANSSATSGDPDRFSEVVDEVSIVFQVVVIAGLIGIVFVLCAELEAQPVHLRVPDVIAELGEGASLSFDRDPLILDGLVKLLPVTEAPHFSLTSGIKALPHKAP